MCYRYSAVDCERETIDRDIIEARQNSLPEPHKSLEYEIHGEFKFSENKRSIHDTYHFSLDELHERGMKKSKFKLAWSKYKNMVADDVDEDMDILPDSDEEGEGEGDGAEDVDEEETGPIGGRGERGRGGGKGRVVGDEEEAVLNLSPPPCCRSCCCWRFRRRRSRRRRSRVCPRLGYTHWGASSASRECECEEEGGG